MNNRNAYLFDFGGESDGLGAVFEVVANSESEARDKLAAFSDDDPVFAEYISDDIHARIYLYGFFLRDTTLVDVQELA
jgi:hypothetical protein